MTRIISIVKAANTGLTFQVEAPTGTDLKLRAGANAPGVLITFEGGDGAGKSTQICFLADVLDALGFQVVRVREPGGTVVGEQLRKIVLDVQNAELSPRSELLIYEAARAQLTDQVIRPALEAGVIVLCDRFTDSTVAYQGYGRGLDLGFVREANLFATDGIVPDATIMLKVPDRKEKQSRVDRRDAMDRLELAGDDFHTRVLSAFDELAQQDSDRFRVINTGGRHSDTAKDIFAALSGFAPWLSDCTVNLDGALSAFDAAHAKPGEDFSTRPSASLEMTCSDNSSEDESHPTSFRPSEASGEIYSFDGNQ